MHPLPSFKVDDRASGGLFALAVTCGTYVRGRTPNEPASLVLYFSGSADDWRFSWMTVASDGARLSFHSGHETLTTPEFAILSAYVHEGIAPAAWALYPRSAVQDDTFSDSGVRDAYSRARRRLCEVLRQVRIGRDVAPLFVVDGEFPTQHDAGAEAAEIRSTVTREGSDSS
jgi:hypothetical protein